MGYRLKVFRVRQIRKQPHLACGRDDFDMKRMVVQESALWTRPLLRHNLSLQPVFWIRIRIDFDRLDPDPGGQKCPTKIEKSLENSCFDRVQH